MSQEQYTTIQQTSLKDLPRIPKGLFYQWIKSKPKWLQIQLCRYY